MADDWKAGLYKIRNGRTVEVLAVRDGQVIGYDPKDRSAETWQLDGHYLDTGESQLDLLPEIIATS